MTSTALAVLAAALVAGGGVVGWAVFRESPTDLTSDLATLRATRAEQEARIERLERSASGGADASRLRRAADEQAARIESGQRGAAPDDAVPRARRALEDLKAVADGGRTTAVEDALAELVRAGEPAVPEIVAVLDSGLEREYGGRFEMMGNAVVGHPGLRLVLFDALRQIGTPSARDGFAKALARSDRLTDFLAVRMYSRYGVDCADPVLLAGFSAAATSMLKSVAHSGLEACADTPNGPVPVLLHWIGDHPAPDDVPAVEQLVLRGRPKGNWAPHEFETAFRTLVQLAPEKAAQATRTLQLAAWDVVNLSGYLNYVSRTSQVRYYEALLAADTLDATARGQLYSRMPNLDERIKDPARRAADVEPIVRFLEARVAAESDAAAKSSAEQALARLHEAIERLRTR